MSSESKNKLNYLLKTWPVGTVATPAWLNNLGVYQQLADRYVKSSWLKKLGQGAFIRDGDKVDWLGGFFALQTQLGLPVHVGGKTALQMRGYSHFVPLGENYPVFVFGDYGTNLPLWFRCFFKTGKNLRYVRTHLFGTKTKLGVEKIDRGSFEILASSPERAILEMLHLIPRLETAEEAYLIMQGLHTLRPKLVQSLLEACHSIKVKRLFLCFAEKENMAWLQRIDRRRISLGKGKRSVVKGGFFDPKYQISVPKELAPQPKDLP